MVWKLYLAGGLIAASFIGGYQFKKLRVEADLAETLQAQKTEHIESLNALQDELDEAAEEAIRLSEELDYAQANTRTVTRTIIKEVPKYVQDSTPTCDRTIGIDALRLLDAAARGTVARPDSAQTSPDDLSDRLPVGVTPAGRYPAE